eukprot:1150319-Pelagomonas_calceolata.AAC.7
MSALARDCRGDDGSAASNGEPWQLPKASAFEVTAVAAASKEVEEIGEVSREAVLAGTNARSGCMLGCVNWRPCRKRTGTSASAAYTPGAESLTASHQHHQQWVCALPRRLKKLKEAKICISSSISITSTIGIISNWCLLADLHADTPASADVLAI